MSILSHTQEATCTTVHSPLKVAAEPPALCQAPRKVDLDEGLNTEGPLSWLTSHTNLALGTGKEANAAQNASLAMLAPLSAEWRVACGLSAFQCIDQRCFLFAG